MGLNKQFYHKTVSSEMVENYIATESGLELDVFWDQYLRTTQVPVFEYHFFKGQFSYRWTNSLKNFNMPLKVFLNGNEMWLSPSNKWQSKKIEIDKLDLKLIELSHFILPMIFNQSIRMEKR